MDDSEVTNGRGFLFRFFAFTGDSLYGPSSTVPRVSAAFRAREHDYETMLEGPGLLIQASAPTPTKNRTYPSKYSQVEVKVR